MTRFFPTSVFGVNGEFRENVSSDWPKDPTISINPSGIHSGHSIDDALDTCGEDILRLLTRPRLLYGNIMENTM